MSDLLNIALELLVPNGQCVEELLQGDRSALLPRMRGLVHEVAFLVKHQLGAHLTRLMACNHTQVTANRTVFS